MHSPPIPKQGGSSSSTLAMTTLDCEQFISIEPSEEKNTADLSDCVTHNKSTSLSERFDFIKGKGVKNYRSIHGHAFLVFWSSVKAEIGHEAIKWQDGK